MYPPDRVDVYCKVMADSEKYLKGGKAPNEFLHFMAWAYHNEKFDDMIAYMLGRREVEPMLAELLDEYGIQEEERALAIANSEEDDRKWRNA